MGEIKAAKMKIGTAFPVERLGVSSWIGNSEPLTQALTQIAEAGFSYVEIWADRVHLDPRNIAEDVKHIHNVLYDLNLTVYSMHLPCTDIRIDDSNKSVNNTSIHLLKCALESCAYLGGEIAVMHPSSKESAVDEETFEIYRMNLEESIKELLLYAKELNIKLALENVPNSSGRRFGSSMADLKGLVEEIKDPYLGLCLDTSHCLLNRLDLSKEVKRCACHLLTIHASDGDCHEDRHWIPTKGILNWDGFLADLTSINYQGIFMLEVAGQGKEVSILKEARAVTKNLLKEKP
jgi:sugar phosphate isomerase/epimerase